MDTNDDAVGNGLCFPYDVLLDILRRVPRRALAASCRLVCRSWRGIVDAHGLLLPHVFPREFPGIFATYYGFETDSTFICPPRHRRRPPLFWDDRYHVKHHCNGLFLTESYGLGGWNDYVCNPATMRCARLPLPCPPAGHGTGIEGVFLAFDPAVSRHHEVFHFPTQRMPEQVKIEPEEPSWIDPEYPFPSLFGQEEPSVEEEPEEPSLIDNDSEQPFLPNLFEEEQHRLHIEEPWQIDSERMLLPYLSEDYSCEEVQPTGEQQHESHAEEPAGPAAEVPEKEVLHVSVFSSRTGEWESREFMPGRCTSRHLYDVVTAPRGEQARRRWSAEYWRGSLYVQCHSGVLMILHCSEGTYDMVQLPGHPGDDADLPSYIYRLPKRCILANYQRGICYVVLNEFRLEVWELTGLAGDQLGWTLAHQTNLKAHSHTVDYLRENQKMQPRMTWGVVESNKDLFTLFKGENIDWSNDVDGDDVTEEEGEEDNYDEAQAEEEEEQDNVDNTQSEEEEEQDGNEEEDQDNIDDTQSEQEEEQDSDEEDEHLRSDTGSEYSWNSDEHNFIDFDASVTGDVYDESWGVRIVGFHPYKDVLLLKLDHTVVAYHLQTSRMQYLGDIYPKRHCQNARDVRNAFPYRPCYIDALPARKTS